MSDVVAFLASNNKTKYLIQMNLYYYYKYRTM
jgi:hypothetical protein